MLLFRPSARRILYVRNLPFNISAEEVRRRGWEAVPPPPLACRRRRRCHSALLTLPFAMPSVLQLYSLFGKYGAIRQIRVGNSKETRGTAYVVYEASAWTDRILLCECLRLGCAGPFLPSLQLPLEALLVLVQEPASCSRCVTLCKQNGCRAASAWAASCHLARGPPAQH